MPLESPPAGPPAIPPRLVPWLVLVVSAAAVAQQTLPPGSTMHSVAEVVVALGAVLGIASTGLQRRGVR